MKLDQQDMVHRLNGQTLRLLPERAIYWQEKDVLLVADLHLGKEATFRAAGIPLPEGPSGETLSRLTAVLRHTGSSRLIVLGDLFHGDNAILAMSASIDNWRRQHQDLAVELVAGSHDRWSGQIPQTWQIKVHYQPLVEEPFILCHYPESSATTYCLAGHLHPGIVLKDRSRADALRLPCFYFGREYGVLPPFGEFTGLTPLSPGPGDTLYVIGDGEIITLPSRL